MSRFWNFLCLHQADLRRLGKLPLTHVTDLYRFRDIRQRSQLMPQSCPVYDGSQLLYFFYGRPSYRPHNQTVTVTARALLPVCLVLRHNLIQQAHRIMPFDTGAFAQKRMHPPIHDEMRLSDFELTTAADAPMLLIVVFYGSERRYYDAKPRECLKYDEFCELEADCYFRMLHNRAHALSDDRVTAVEVQLNSPVDLAMNVHAAILPKPYLDSPGIASQVEDWGGIAIPYNVQEEFKPGEIHGAIFDKLTTFFEQEGFFDNGK